MKRSRLISGIEFILLLGALAAALKLPRSPFSWSDVLWFFLGLIVLKLSDVWLPRGDAVGMSSSIALGALLLFDARVVLGMLVLAEVVTLLPRGRSLVWPAALSALAAEALATVACSALLVPLQLHPASTVLLKSPHALRGDQYAAVLAVGLLFATLEFVLLEIEAAAQKSQPIRAALLGSLSFGGWLIAAQASAGVLAALMYNTMGVWGLAVSVVMVLVMRQSFVLLLEIRQAYSSTIAVLVKAMEAQSPGREGVAERNARVCTAVGREIGLHGRELERLRYAALLLGIAESEERIEGEPSLSIGPSRIVQEVEFLGDVVPILELCDTPRSLPHARRSDLTCAYAAMAVGVATGSVRPEALAELSGRVSPRVRKEIDSALSRCMPVDLSEDIKYFAGSA